MLLLRATRKDRFSRYDPRATLFALADGWLWLWGKTSNGNQKVLKAVAEVPECLSSRRGEYDSLHKLYTAVTNTYPQLIALPGFERLSEGMRSALISQVYSRTDHTQQNQPIESVLKDAKGYIKEAIDKANLELEAPLALAANLVELEEPLALAANLVKLEEPLDPLDDIRDPCNHKSYKGLDIGALDTLYPDLYIEYPNVGSYWDAPDGLRWVAEWGVEELGQDTCCPYYSTQLPSEKSLEVADKTIGDSLNRDSFMVKFELDQVSYRQVVKESNSKGSWTAYDGTQWKAKGQAAKAVWTKVEVAI